MYYFIIRRRDPVDRGDDGLRPSASLPDFAGLVPATRGLIAAPWTPAKQPRRIDLTTRLGARISWRGHRTYVMPPDSSGSPDDRGSDPPAPRWSCTAGWR